MELLSDRVVIQRLWRYLTLGVAVLVFALAAVSIAFAFRQQRSSVAGSDAALQFPRRIAVETLQGRDWEILRGEWQVVDEDTLKLSAHALMISSQPAIHFSFQSTYWLDGSGANPGDTPSLYFKYQDLQTTYRVTHQKPDRLVLEKGEGGEWAELAWVQVDSPCDVPSTITIEIHEGRIRSWLNGYLLIDYTDHNPLTGDGYGIAVGSKPIFWKVERVNALGPG